jgi:hypothetical protein
MIGQQMQFGFSKDPRSIRKAKNLEQLRSLFDSDDESLIMQSAAMLLGWTLQKVKVCSTALQLNWRERKLRIIQDRKQRMAIKHGVRVDQIHDTERTCRFKLYVPKKVHPLDELAVKLNCTRSRISYQMKKGLTAEQIPIKKDWDYKARVQRLGLTKMQGARAVRMKISPENYLHRLLEIKIARHAKSDAKRRRMEWIRKPTIQFMKRKSDRFNPKYGTTSNGFRSHIEKQFTRKMTWENHGKVWHLDHIMPLSKFDLSDRNQLLIACNWQNFQPLLARQNLSKSDKILMPQLSLILQTK